MNTKLSELDGYLAEGMRILESERDNLRSEVEALRELLRQASELIQEQDAHLEVDMLPAGCALMVDVKAALSQQAEPAPINQCGGCQAGVPVDDAGYHRMGKPDASAGRSAA